MPPPPDSSPPAAVFISYAREDAGAARRIADALRSHGLEVWFDEAELRGGDAWDAKIKKQIRGCALFLAVVSTRTQIRHEGYFRREWKLAIDRTQDMAHGVPFLVPVVIDETREADALAPEEFLRVQWTRLPGALPTPEFVAQVKRLLDPETVTRSSTGGARPLRTHEDSRGPATPQRRNRPALLWGALATVVAIGAAWFVTKKSSSPAVVQAPAASGAVAAAPTVAAPSADDHAVAVLPFANLSGDQSQEYFSDGLTEEILNALARERDLRVPGRTSSFSFKGKNISPAEIAKALNVTRLIEGSVRRDGRRVRISISLTRASDGFSEEVGTFTEEVADIFALYDKIARAVVEKVARRATTSGAVAVQTKNPEAYDAYLQGRAIATRSSGNSAQVAAHYERAVGLDPAFALAWSGLAVARFAPYVAAQDRSPEVAAASRKAIDRAIALQPDLPEALIARANWERHVNGDYAAAGRDLARAEALQPPTASLRIMQTWLERDLGNWDQAYRHARETLALDPQNGGNAFALALSLYAERGDYSEADRLAIRANAISGVQDSQTYLPILVRFIWRGPETALRFLDRNPERYSATDRAKLLLALGRIDEARVVVDAWERDGTSFQRKVENSIRDRYPETLIVLQLGIGRPEMARRVAEQMQVGAQQEIARGNRAPAVRNALICAEIALDHREAALAALADWRKEVGRWPNAFQRISNFNWRAAKLYGSMGQADEAVALLEECFAAGLQPLLNLRFDASFAPIRQDPRFQKLIEQQSAWTKAQPDPLDP